MKKTISNIMETLKILYNHYDNHRNDNKGSYYIEKIKNEYKKHNLEIDATKKNLLNNIDELSDMFNTVLLNLSDILEKEYKNDIEINLYNAFIKSTIEKKKKEPISMFILKIYKNDKYRNNILKKNDDFFLDVDNHKESLNGSDDKLSKLFMFKNFWKNSSNSLKEYIRNSCITMVKICENYINLKVELNELTEIFNLLKHA